MTQADFLEALEAELRLRGARYDLRALQEFVAAAWPVIDEDPDTGFWAGEFIAGGNATLTA
jgi:hypothetical protein